MLNYIGSDPLTLCIKSALLLPVSGKTGQPETLTVTVPRPIPAPEAVNITLPFLSPCIIKQLEAFD